MSETILEVQGLVGGYGKMTILNGTSFSVPAGSITTVIGPNGAGKSTVFKAIFGLLKLREGKVIFGGRDVTGLNQRELLTAGISYVPQGRNIFPELSVRHNIELGSVAAGRDIADLPARIEAALDKFPVLRKKADAAGIDPVGRRAEAARNRPQPAARSEADAGRRAVDRPFAADGAADLQHPEGIARPRRVDPDDRAERALGAGDFRLRHRARTRPDPPGRQGRAGAERSPDRPVVPRRRHDG